MQQPTITLTVQQGPQRGQRLSVTKDSIIGRVAGSDVVISDPEVSRRHASITWERGQPVIRDLGSTNGTFVNGVRLTGPQTLRDGDTIGLGKVQLGFQCPALAGAYPTVAKPAPPPPAYAPPPAPPVEARRGPGGLSWLALGLFGLAVVILLIAAAIGAYVYTHQGEEVAGVPAVIINSPASGSQVQLGQEVIVQATATDSRGVTHIELLVNGVLYGSDVSPNPQGQSPFISRQSWRAPSPGTYTLMVKAYNAAGGVSQLAAITVNVAGAATPTPGQPTATPVATDTPVATGTPTVTPTPLPDTPTATPIPTPTVCNLDAIFVADVSVPDGTVFAPGARIDKIWRIRNSGNCPWESGYQWVFVSGEQMGASPSQAVPATAAGATVDIGVTLYAPSAPGTYTGYWRMKSSAGQIFGQTCSVKIVVPSPATATPTNTPIPTATPTQPPPPPANITFTVDDDTITAGDCTTLRVHIENVQAAHVSGAEYSNTGVTGPDWSGSTCPGSTTTYTLHVIKLDSSTEDKTVTVTVNPAGPAPCVPNLVSPANGATLDNGRTDHLDDIVWDFDWSDCDGATQYHLYVIKSGAAIPVVDKDDIPASSYHHVQSGAYVSAANLTGWTWRVRARVGGAWGDWSPTRSFSVEPPDTDPASGGTIDADITYHSYDAATGWVTFSIVNNAGGATLECVRGQIVNRSTSANYYGPGISNSPFRTSPTQTSAGDPSMTAGQTRYLRFKLSGNPTGVPCRATITLYTQDDSGGSNVTKTVDFDLP